MLATLATVMACGGSPPPPSPIAHTAPASIPAPRAISDELIDQILTNYLRDPKTMPDAGLLEADSGPILVVVTIENGTPVTPELLPASPRPFKLVTLDEVGKHADATGQEVHYIHIDAQFAKGGQHASVAHGVGLKMPKTSHAIVLCCCTSSRGFDRTDGTWVASELVMMMCS